MAEANTSLATSIATSESTVTITRLKRLLSQHLRSLAQAGVETLPHSSERLQFDLQAIALAANDIATSSTATATAQDTLITAQDKLASAQVRESVSEIYSSHSKARNHNHHETPEINQAVSPPISKPHSIAQPKSAQPSSTQRLPMAVPGDQKSYGESLPMLARKSALDVLQTEVAACTRCCDLSACRTQTVFGTGNVTPRLVFLGEAPGADEDKKGEPFVGASGELLNKILTASKLTREEVYILNTVKCRPPNNRTPAQLELDNCWQFTKQQLEILQPEFICCLGSVAAKRLLNSGLALGRLRGQFHRYHDSRVVVTYHPSYLLRTGNEKTKRQVWEDMKMLRKAMGVDL